MSAARERDAQEWTEFWAEVPALPVLPPTPRDWAERIADELVAQSGARFDYLQMKVLVEGVRRGFSFRI